MKLQDIVTYHALLESVMLDTKTTETELHTALNKLNKAFNTETINFDNLKENIHQKQIELLKNITGIKGDLNKFMQQLNELVPALEHPYYLKSISVHDTDLKKTLPDKEIEHDNYNILHNAESRELFDGRLLNNISFKWPGLQIGPVRGIWTDKLIALDPLYLADNSEDRFLHVKKMWTPIYQNRLRYYTFDDNHEHPLHMLPEAQLGFIVAIDWFNFKTEAIIERYLQSAYRILRPGGHMLFTYNNCNYPKAIDKVEQMHYSYINGNNLKQFVKTTGYIIEHAYDGELEREDCVSWLEIKKPGYRQSIRGGQNLGAIKQL
jgi:hypothetical protein